MSKPMDILLAGFGGQGVLFAGKVIATAGLIEDREVSWLPSYGPEMRGGTANCSVTLSDEAIGSPLITEPTALLALNQPSLHKFIDTVVPGGIVIADSTMIHYIDDRPDVRIIKVPATALAEEAGLKGLANIVMVGKLWAEEPFCDLETLEEALIHTIPPRKAAMLEKNQRALRIGMDYQG